MDHLHEIIPEGELTVFRESLLFPCGEEAALFDAFGEFAFDHAGDEDDLRFHRIAAVHACHGHMVECRRDGGVGEGRETVFEEGAEIFGCHRLIPCDVDDLIQKAQYLLPDLQVGAKACLFKGGFIPCRQGVRHLLAEEKAVEYGRAVFGGDSGSPRFGKRIEKGGEARAPFIHAAALGELGLGQRRGRLIEIAAAALLPAVMPLPWPDAAGKDVVFQSVDFFL